MAVSRRSIARIFRFPLIIALIAVFGLVSALLGDGVWDAASWIALTIPLLIMTFFLLRP
ncbi:hypothetical protein [Bradyrhizobium sp. STM 3562]|uniref:hypothetical protein n=1 Tax=Bradyrhizobium sp. STM 3562 TaxID=578924 RepID=UPI0038907CEC